MDNIAQLAPIFALEFGDIKTAMEQNWNIPNIIGRDSGTHMAVGASFPQQPQGYPVHFQRQAISGMSPLKSAMGRPRPHRSR